MLSHAPGFTLKLAPYLRGGPSTCGNEGYRLGEGQAGVPSRLIRILVPRSARHCYPAGDAHAEVPTELPPKCLALGLNHFKVPTPHLGFRVSASLSNISCLNPSSVLLSTMHALPGSTSWRPW